MKFAAVMRPASIASAESQPPSIACRPNSPIATALPRLALPFTVPRWLFRNLTRLGIMAIAGLLGSQIIPVVDPHLDSNVPLGRRCFREAVLDLRPQRREGDAPFHRLLAAGHLGPAEAAR